MSKTAFRIGYVPLTPDYSSPADRRRFVAYCRARGMDFEIASPYESYDAVVVSETADLTTWCEYARGPVVFDLIDSFLAIPRWRVRQWLRGTELYLMGRHRRLNLSYWSALERMCTRADAVVCTTDEQRSDIQRYCANVHVVLDFHDAAVRRVKTDFTAHSPFRLFWEGLPSNIPQLQTIGKVLTRVSRSRPLELHVVSDPEVPIWHGFAGGRSSAKLAQRAFPNVRFHVWSESTLSDTACDADLGVIPIDLEDPLASGKPENKLLLLWRLGLPVVAAATPAYLRAMRTAGLERFAIDRPEAWEEVLCRLIDDGELRARLARSGRGYAETNHGATQLLDRWDRVFASIGVQLSRTEARFGHIPS